MLNASEMAKRNSRMKHKVKPSNSNLPYERFCALGAESLTDSELIAIILRTGTKDKSAIQLAEQVLKLGKAPREGLLGLYDVSLEQLMTIKGIGEVKAVKLKCIAALSMRIRRYAAKEGLQIQHSNTVAEYFMEQLRHRETECVMLVCLDTKGQILKETLISTGSVRMSLISPREIFIEALQHKAVNIILIHNHPSGDPTPSRQDCLLTQNLSEMGKKINVPLLDHIIIGNNRYTSFKELSLL